MPQVLKYSARLNQYAIWLKGFTPEEVERIVFLENLLDFQKGQVGLGPTTNEPPNGADPNIRDSDVFFFGPDQNTGWIFDKFSWIVSRVNYDHFMYNIDGYDSFQYTKYGVGQHYDWHFDNYMEYMTWERKISATIMLSDPSEYEGGELEIIHDGNPNHSQKLKPEKGDIVFFASWMPHKVHPITAGERKSLVCWINGKREG